MFGSGDGSAPQLVCPWAGLCQLRLAREAALAAMKTAKELADSSAFVEAKELAEAAVKTAEKTAEEVAVGFHIKKPLRKQDKLPTLPPKELRTSFEQFIAERQNHSEA